MVQLNDQAGRPRKEQGATPTLLMILMSYTVDAYTSTMETGPQTVFVRSLDDILHAPVFIHNLRSLVRARYGR